MRARAWTCSLLALLLVSLDARAARVKRTLFTFAAGSGLFARPGIGPAGALYVGSGDGYVHALGAEGSYRWSYTVKGRVLAPPLEEPESGRLFVATSEARLYALESDARLRWVFSLPSAPKTELVLTPSGTLYFVGQDEHLYGVTTGGALRLRLAAAAARSAPAWLAEQQVGVVLAGQLATLKGYGYERAPLGATFGESAELALGADRAIFACDDGLARVVSRSFDELSIASDCRWPPVRGEGFVAIAEAGGAVRLLFADGSTESLQLGAAPLRPSWDAARRRLILATATGAVTVIELEGAR